MPSRVASCGAAAGTGVGIVQVATRTKSISSAETPLAASALLAGLLGHVDDRLVGVGPAALGDARPGLDPLVVGVDAAGDQIVVGDDVGRPVVTEPEEPGAAGALLVVTSSIAISDRLPTSRRATGSPAATMSPSVAQPLGEYTGFGRDDRVFVPVGGDRADPGAAGDLESCADRRRPG